MTEASARPRALFALASAMPVALNHVGARKTFGPWWRTPAAGRLRFQAGTWWRGQRLKPCNARRRAVFWTFASSSRCFALDFPVCCKLDLLLLLDDLHLHFFRPSTRLAGLELLANRKRGRPAPSAGSRSPGYWGPRSIGNRAAASATLRVGNELRFLPRLRGLRRLDHRIAVGPRPGR